MLDLAEISHAWRVVFKAQPASDDTVLIRYNEPTNGCAVATAVAPNLILEPAAPAGDALLLLVMNDSASNTAAEKQVDGYFSILAKTEPVFRGSVRAARVAWSRNRVFIACAADIEDEIVDAALRFTLAARATFDLERDMMAAWPQLNQHSNLSHAITGADQSEQSMVNTMTEKFARMKMVHLRVQNAVEQLDPLLGSHSKRLFAQLVSPAALHDRMEMLEDPIQFGQDHYELANTRLIEGKYSSTELRLEWLIVVILLAELLAILADKVHWN